MTVAVEYRSGALARYAGWVRPAVRVEADEVSPFARLLGQRWLFLPPAVRRRFLRKVALGACVTYVGCSPRPRD